MDSGPARRGASRNDSVLREGVRVSRRSSVCRLYGAHQIAGVGVVELIADTLVQHVGVDAVGSQQRDALLALRAFLLQPRQLGSQRDDFLIELLPGVQSVFAGIGVDAEIA